MLDAVPVHDVVPTNIAPPPVELGGKVEICLDKDGRVIARTRDLPLR